MKWLTVPVVVLLLLTTTRCVLQAAEEPVALGKYRQLFLDDRIIDSMRDLTRRMHKPRRYSPKAILPGPNPPEWELGGAFMRAAPQWIPKEKLFKVWYTCFPKGHPDTKIEQRRPAMATSRDGIHWIKPNLGVVKHKGQDTNLFKFGATGGSYDSGVIVDPHNPDPKRRYKTMVWAPPAFGGFWQAFGWYPIYSADGVHWSDAKRSERVYNQDDAYTVCDELGQQYLMPGKQWNADGNIKNNHNPRQWGIRTSRHFNAWPEAPPVVFAADARDQEMGRRRLVETFADPNRVHPVVNEPDHYMTDIYELAVFPYEGMYLGIASVFDRSGRLKGNQAGIMHLQLTCSRNLTDWTRLGNRQPFLELAEKTKFDSGWLIPTTRPVLMGDELWFYYVGGPCAHDWGESRVSKELQGIGLAKLRRDGFISLDAGEQPGSLTTVPVLLGGDRLHVNVDATGGRLRVALRDVNGEPLAGFGLDDTVPITGDQPAGTVRWKTEKQLPKQPVQIVFELAEAQLYSFWTSR